VTQQTPRFSGGVADPFGFRGANRTANGLFYSPRERGPFDTGEDEEIKLLAPEDFATKRGRHSPIIVMCMGRRNTGKTFTMTGMAKAKRRRYDSGGLNDFSIGSNYWMAPEVANYVSQYIMDRIAEYPRWARKMTLYLDEIQNAASSRRSMSKQNVGLSSFLTMVRKRQIEVMFTTQFPQVIDYQVLLQVDLFIEVEQDYDFHTITIYIHDWWGQYTGKNWRKPWPPRRWDADDTVKLVIPNPQTIFNSYDTDEVIANVYSDSQRAQMVDEEYGARGWAERLPMDKAMQVMEEDGLPDRFDPFDLAAKEAEFLTGLRDVGSFKLRRFVSVAKDLNLVNNQAEFRAWLHGNGFALSENGQEAIWPDGAEPE